MNKIITRTSVIFIFNLININSCKIKNTSLYKNNILKDIENVTTCEIDKNHSMTRRLTNQEYINSVSDILFINGEQLKPLLPLENASEGFKNSSLTFYTSEEHIIKYEETSSKIIDLLSNNEKYIKTYISTCLKGESCEKKFIEKIGLRLFRRPVTEKEISSYLELFKIHKEIKNDLLEGSKVIVRAMLMSPQFLFRLEKTKNDVKEPRLLDSYEMATRMALFVWHSAPDEELLDSASKNLLQDTDTINKQLDRMLADPKGKRAFEEFITEWLNINQLLSTQRSTENFPEFTTELANDMITEVKMLLSDYVFDQNRSILAALQTPYTYLSARLAKFYGFPPKEEGFQKYSLEKNNQRFGLLSTPGFLTGISPGDEVATIGRGLFMARKFLCQEVPPPPPAALALAGAISTIPIKTPKERLKIHSQPTCSSCHQFIDPMGLGLEQYDSIGHYRTVYNNGEKIHIEEIFSDGKKTQKIKNLSELAEQLRTSELAYSCYLLTVMQYAYLRKPTFDSCEIKSIKAQHISSEMGYKTLVKALVNSSNFKYIQNQP